MKSVLVEPNKASVILGLSLLLALALAIGAYMAASSPTPVSSQSPEYPAYESDKLFSFPGDWSQIPDATARLVYPGQASWQYLTGSLHPGSSSVQAGTVSPTSNLGTSFFRLVVSTRFIICWLMTLPRSSCSAHS